MSSPPSMMRPGSGCSKPAIIRSVVVLPEPDGPSSVKNSPSATAGRRRRRRRRRRMSCGSPRRRRQPPRQPSRMSSPRSSSSSAIGAARGGGSRCRRARRTAAAARARAPRAVMRGRLLAGRSGSSIATIGPSPRTSEPCGAIASSRSRKRSPICVGARPRSASVSRSRAAAAQRERVAAERTAEPAGGDGVHQLGAARDGRERQAAAERLARTSRSGSMS